MSDGPNGSPIDSPSHDESYRQSLKEFVSFVFLIFLPLIGILLVFPLNMFFGLMGQAIGAGLLLNSLFAGGVLLLAAGKGRAFRITLALLSFALYLGVFHLVRSTGFVVEEAMKVIVPLSMPFLLLAVSRTLYRAFFPAEYAPRGPSAQGGMLDDES